MIGFACPAAAARSADRAYDETQRRADEISINIPVQRHGEIVQETYLLNPAPEDLVSSDLASVGDVEFATPVYVAQHLAVIGMLVGPEVQHVELVFGCPFSCWSDEALKSELREALRGPADRCIMSDRLVRVTLVLDSADPTYAPLAQIIG